MQEGGEYMRRQLLITAVIFGLVGALALGGTQVFAQSSNQPSFVQQLAQKLGLDQTKVQQAVDEIRQDHRNRMDTRFNEMLDQAVKDGKITTDQKDKILQKRQELQNIKKDFKNMTPEQRRQAMQNQRQQLEEWAKQNNINLNYLFGKGPFMHFGGFKGKWGDK